jgi:hypothetical protein
LRLLLGLPNPFRAFSSLGRIRLASGIRRIAVRLVDFGSLLR